MIKVSDKEAEDLMRDYIEPWDESTTMPFGKHKGIALSDVPAQYLLWWFGENTAAFPGLREYIEKNYDALENEAASEKAYHCE